MFHLSLKPNWFDHAHRLLAPTCSDKTVRKDFAEADIIDNDRVRYSSQVKELNEELRNAKAQAESARAEAEAADMAKSNFLATM